MGELRFSFRVAGVFWRFPLVAVVIYNYSQG